MAEENPPKTPFCHNEWEFCRANDFVSILYLFLFARTHWAILPVTNLVFTRSRCVFLCDGVDSRFESLWSPI